MPSQAARDYELLFTVKEENVKKMYSAILKNRLSPTIIGEITERKEGILLVDSKGAEAASAYRF